MPKKKKKPAGRPLGGDKPKTREPESHYMED